MDHELFQIMLNRIIVISVDNERERSLRSVAESKISEPRFDIAEVYNLMSAMTDGRKIEAIKAYRTITGAGLKESKDAVEAVMDRVR